MEKPGMERVPTGEFAMKLIASENFEEFYAENIEQMQAYNLPDYLSELCWCKGILPHELVRKTDIDRVYGHKIFAGERKPSRDYVLKLALGLELSVEEAQRLLTISKNSQLYPRVPRDAAILYCLHHGVGYRNTKEKLYEWGMTILGDK